jgi:uncharacterized cupredoxin-like copper-binding protein
MRTSCLLAAAAFLLFAGSAAAEQMALAAEQQVPLILKVLTYDRQFEARTKGTEVAIGIVYDPADRDSAKATDEISSTLFKWSGKTVKKLPIKYFTIEYVSHDQVEKFVKQKNINVIYVAPGNSKNLTSLTKMSQALGITSVTGVPDYVRKGVAVGIGVVQDRPQVLINLTSSKSEGSDFDASLLRLATVWR